MQSRVVVLVYGFSCAFGGMFAKTWRVHVLFTNKKMSRKVCRRNVCIKIVAQPILQVVKDLHLFGLVFVLLIIDTIILVAWLVVDPLRWTLVILPDEV